MRQESGFTLIEVIASLLLVSIMAVVAGVGIAWFAQGYVLAKEATHTAQKAQLAMSRLSRELKELSSIATSSDSTQISFGIASGNRQIGLVGATIRIATGVALAGGDILIANVTSFNLTYYQDYQADPKQLWDPSSDDIDDLTVILIRFNLSGVGGTFETIIYPRNT